MNLGQRIDRLPSSVGAVLGVAAGLALGIWSASMPLWPGGGLFVLVVGLGLVIAARGQAVTVPVVDTRSRPASDVTRPVPVPVHVPEDAPYTEATEATGLDEREHRQPEHAFDPLAWRQIPAGRFTMGSPDDDPMAYDNEKPAHEVALSGFWCMVYPVTHALYADVLGRDPGWPRGGGEPESDEIGRLPANEVSWLDAVRFCNRLSESRGLGPCYELHDDGRVTWHRDMDGYRLPTEAEWEYACRAGTHTRWWFGDGDDEVAEYAWIDKNSSVADPETGEPRSQPQPVGTKPENPWGLCDMHGNVWEWCWDWYKEYGEASDRVIENPAGPSDDEAEGSGDKAKVLRGGAFNDRAWFTRCAFRDGFWPEDRDWDFGFRCVRGSARQPGSLIP